MKKTIEQLLEEDKQDENLLMCQRIREDLDKQFGSLDVAFAELRKFADKRKHEIAMERAQKTAHRKSRARKSQSLDDARPSSHAHCK